MSIKTNQITIIPIINQQAIITGMFACHIVKVKIFRIKRLIYNEKRTQIQIRLNTNNSYY